MSKFVSVFANGGKVVGVNLDYVMYFSQTKGTPVENRLHLSNGKTITMSHTEFNRFLSAAGLVAAPPKCER